MLNRLLADSQPPSRTIRQIVGAILLASLVLALTTAALAAHARADQSQATRITSEQAITLAIQGETGADDFRISDMGRPDTNYDAFTPAVAYNSTANEYLVVWSGDDNTNALLDEEFEIYGQRLDATTGATIGEDFRISDMGPEANADYDAIAPAVAYNSTDNEYLVVWHGEDNTGALVEDEFEIFGQRLDAASGAEIGGNLRISEMGPTAIPDYDALLPAVAYNIRDNEYLVVWSADDNTGGVIDNEFEIFGQRLNASDGSDIGSYFRISHMGPDANADYDASAPAIAYNITDNEYLVVWHGDDNTGTLRNDEVEIFGQRLDAASGAEIGDDFRISNMGPAANADYDAFSPAVAYNSARNEYFIVWSGDDNTDGLIDEEYEIFGQRLNASDGSEIGIDFRISEIGPAGGTLYRAQSPAVTLNSSDNQYLVVWYGDDNTGALVEDEQEIYGQLLDAESGIEIGSDFRISDMGPDGDRFFDAFSPAVAYNPEANEYQAVWSGSGDNPVGGKDDIYGQRLEGSSGTKIGQNDFQISFMGGDLTFDAFDADVAYNNINNEFLVVWRGDDNTIDQVDDEFEIFGQRLDGSTGAELGADFRISAMGPDMDAAYDAFSPAVTYNPTNNQYLVVWSGDANTGGLIDEEFEIYGQRLEADTGVMIGVAFRISTMGPDGDADFDAFNPVVAYNNTDSQYLVAWHGDSLGGGLFDDELEIFIQRLDANDGTEIGGDVRISTMGSDGVFGYDALNPAVVYNNLTNEYLVTWHGDDDSGSLIDEAFEIFGQRLNAANGSEIGDDFRIDAVGPEGDIDYDALDPAVSYNSTANQYLVVWEGDDNNGGLVDGEVEIFGQRLNGSDASELGGDFRISTMGPDGDPNYDAGDPTVIYDSASDQFLVVWEGDDNTGSLMDSETEIFGQRLDAVTGIEIGDMVGLSTMGEDGDVNFDALNPAAAYNNVAEEALVVWRGDDNTMDQVDDEFEIFGQRYQSLEILHLPIFRKDG